MSMYNFDWNTLDDQTVTSKFGSVELIVTPQEYDWERTTYTVRGKEYTAQEYLTGKDEAGNVVLPEIHERVKRNEDMLKNIGKIPRNLIVGAIILLGLVVVAGVVN